MQIQNMFSRLLLPLLLAIELPTARAQSLVQNGGLEDLSSTYVNESAGYMSLGAGSTAISGWKVADGVAGSIAWGNTDFTGGFAHDGKFFVDLTGLGNASPNGAIDQTLSITRHHLHGRSLSRKRQRRSRGRLGGWQSALPLRAVGNWGGVDVL